MTLLTAGYWHTTYWAESYWMQDYWLEYGTVTPPAAPTIKQGMRPTRIRKRRRTIEKRSLLDNPELLNLLITFIELD